MSRGRAVPPFPWKNLREIVTLGGMYASNTSAENIAGGVRDPVRWQSVKFPERALVGEALRRAFGENRARHKMTAAHFKIFMACELGMVSRPTGHGMSFTVYDADHPDYVMTDEEAARTFGVSVARVPRYHSDARRAIEDEWRAVHSGLGE